MAGHGFAHGRFSVPAFLAPDMIKAISTRVLQRTDQTGDDQTGTKRDLQEQQRRREELYSDDDGGIAAQSDDGGLTGGTRLPTRGRSNRAERSECGGKSDLSGMAAQRGGGQAVAAGGPGQLAAGVLPPGGGVGGWPRKFEEVERQVAKAPPACGTADRDQSSVILLHAHFGLTKVMLDPCTIR
jgi:hypothetical protein